MRLASVALLLAVIVAGCGAGERAPRASAPSVAGYAATTNRLCAELVDALRRAFDDAADDPDLAIAHYARDVAAAGGRFAAVAPPPSLARFGAATVRHVRREAAALRLAAARSAGGDRAAARRALGMHGGLLPDAIPGEVLRRAPACGGVGPAPPDAPGEDAVVT
jgi:hypothetical protein